MLNKKEDILHYYIIDTQTKQLKFVAYEEYPHTQESEELIETECIYTDGLHLPIWNGSEFIEGKTEEEISTAKNETALIIELNEIKEWFKDTDYIVMKVIRGNWSEDDERYLKYQQDYITKHDRKTEIERKLNIEEDNLY